MRPPAPRPRFQVTELEPRLTPAGDLFVVPPADTVGGPVQLRFEWGASDGQFRNEFGIYNVDDAAGRLDGLLPSDPGYAGAALGRAKAVLAKGADYGAKAEVTTAGGQLLGFYLVPNATTLEAQVAGATVYFSFAAANADGFDHQRTVTRGDGGLTLNFEDQFGGGDRDFNDAIVSVTRTRAIATPGTTGQAVPATFTRLAGSGGLTGEVGLYKVGRDGSVGGIAPGAPGYLQAALGSAGRQTIFAAGSSTTDSTLTLDGGSLYGFYFLTAGTADQIVASAAQNGAVAYFTFSDANPDGLDHVAWRAADTFGVGGQLGGGDKNFSDGVFRISFGTPQDKPASPTPPPTVPPPTPDTTAPTATFQLTNDTSSSSTDLVTSDARGVLTVTDDSGTVATLKAGFDSTDAATYADLLSRRGTDGTVTVDAALLTALNRGTALADGPHTLYVQASDPTGNSQVSQFAFTLDTAAPTASYALATDSGASSTDLITNDARGTLTVADATSTLTALRAGFGTADIDILSRRAADGTVAVDAALLTQLNHGTTLPDGVRTLLAQATDAAGNTQSFQFPFTLDTVAPVAPTFDLTAATDSGAAGDQRTDQAVVSLAGTAEAGTTLELTRPVVPGTPGDGTPLARATAQADGTFTFVGVALNVGPNSFTVRAVDAAGNPGTTFSQTITRNTPPTVANAIADQTTTVGAADTTFDLATVFADAERVLRFNTAYPNGQTGSIDVNLFAAQAPNTVNNILAYVNSANAQQNFNGSIFHRLVPGFVLQGGGFKYDPTGTTTATTFPTLTKLAPVANEPVVANTSGTIAMAKVGTDPNSATDEFFFNLADNSSNLDNQNGGFTVFGQVMNGGQQALNTLVTALTTYSGSGIPGAPPFPVSPTANTSSFPTNITAADLATITTASELTAAQRMTFAATASPTGVATATVVNNTLTLHAVAPGTTTITVRATDLDGSVTTFQFSVTVS